MSAEAEASPEVAEAAPLAAAAAAPPPTPADGASYDLTPLLGEHLDRHLVFPLLEFLQVQGVHPEAELLAAKIELLQHTNMVDFALDIHASLHGPDAPGSGELNERRGVVVARLRELQATAAKVVGFLTNPQLVKLLRPSDKAYNLEMLRTEHQIGEDDIEALYHYAKFQYECGNYSGAAEFLRYYRSLCSSAERSVAALWGKCAADILMQDWDEASEDLNRLREVIDSKSGGGPLAQLQQRTWLAHWALFVFFNHENGRNAIIDLFFQERFMAAITQTSRHLLRYLAAAVVVNRRRRAAVKDLVRILVAESHAYSDPVTRFLVALFDRHDFDAAQAALADCDALLRADFFLVGLRDEFLDRGRAFLFEQYVRVHTAIDLKALSARLAMPQEEAERWVVNLIRNERLPATVDLVGGTVRMAPPGGSVYDATVERAKTLNARTAQLAAAVAAMPALGHA